MRRLCRKVSFFRSWRCFAAGDDLALDEIRPAGADAGGLADPQNIVQIAQAASDFLQVGLEIGVVIARVPLLLFEQFGLGKLPRIQRLFEVPPELPEQLAVAVE